MEQGWDRIGGVLALNYCVPMLTGTLVTAAGFPPIGFATGMANMPRIFLTWRSRWSPGSSR